MASGWTWWLWWWECLKARTGSRRWWHKWKPCICSFGFIEKDICGCCARFSTRTRYRSSLLMVPSLLIFISGETSKLTVIFSTHKPARFIRSAAWPICMATRSETEQKWKTGFESIHLYYWHHMENKNPTERFYYIIWNDTVHILHFTRFVYLEGC